MRRKNDLGPGPFWPDHRISILVKTYFSHAPWDCLKIMTHPYPTSPQVAVGAVVFKENAVLLVRRNQSPAKGLWAIPGGSVELGESLQAAAEREIREETGIRIRANAPCYTFDVVERDDTGKVRFHYVIVDLAAEYVSGEPKAGDDASEARWVPLEQVGNLTVSSHTRDLLQKMISPENVLL